MKKIISLASGSTIALTTAWSLCLVNPETAEYFVPQAAAASSKKTHEYKDGLDPAARAFINQGQWAEAIDHLKNLSDKDQVAGRNAAWLAFAYLYQGKHAELKELADKTKSLPANTEDPTAGKIVETFALVSLGKLDDANKSLSSLPETANNDLLLTFTRACVALKKGDPKTAARYCETCVEIEPSFAWGYRTLGFIHDKALKNPDSAERAYERALAVEPNFKEVRDLLVDLRLSRNDFDGAISTVRSAIQKSPKDSNNYYRLAQIYIQQWRLQEALEQLDKAISLNGSDARCYRSRAAILHHQGKLAEAIVEQEKAVTLGKDRAFELIELANLQEQAGETNKAITSLLDALKTTPTNQVARQKLIGLLTKEKRYEDLIAEYKKEVERQPKSAPARLGLAEVLQKTGKLDEALEQLKEAANLDQKDPRPHRETGKIELGRKNYGAAAKAYTRALNINPSSVEDLVALGFCYANNNDYMQAETAFVTGLALQQLGQTTGAAVPVNPFDIMRSLASVLITEGRFREAAVNMDAVVGADKDPGQKRQDELILLECKALRDCSVGSIKELIAAFNALPADDQKANRVAYINTLLSLGKNEIAIEQVGKIPAEDWRKNHPLTLVKILRAKNETANALDLAKQSANDAKLDPESQAGINQELGQMLAAQGDLKGAEAAFAKAVELNPKAFSIFVAKGRMYLARNRANDPDVISAAEKALEINPYCVPAYMLLGDAYLKFGKLKEAEGNYLKAVELYPSSSEAHKGLREAYTKLSKMDDAKRESEIISNLDKSNS